jgi:hypothetical protein
MFGKDEIEGLNFNTKYLAINEERTTNFTNAVELNTIEISVKVRNT